MAGATPPGTWRGVPWRDDADADQVIQSPWRFSLPGPTVAPTVTPVPTVAASAQAPTLRTVVRRGTSTPFAYADGSAVVIERDAVAGERRSGGTRAWRNNNPGNLVSGAFATTNGSIGAAAGFAVFPDSASGAAALTALLQTATYQALTVGNAINRYDRRARTTRPTTPASSNKRSACPKRPR